MDAENTFYQYPWVILKLNHELYGIAAPYVQTMVAMPSITSVPHQPEWVRGVVNLRGQVMPLIDLRLRLGMPSYMVKIKGLVKMVEQREKDHHDWLVELENSVRERREFTLTTDPHKCKFGQWYDRYKPASLYESQLLLQFDEPHRRIHSLAKKVSAQVAEGRADHALALIENTRDGDLAAMQKLFGDFRRLMNELAETEIAIVLANMGRVAVAADAIESVEMLAEESAGEMPVALRQGEKPVAPYVGKRKKTNEIIYLIDPSRIVEKRNGN